jgi:hypothetical protein
MKAIGYRYCIAGLFATCLLFTLATSAQKLPHIQQVSVHAPADIKIDGKATEWNNRFQAYNTNNQLFYTIANDEENLYLIISTAVPRTMNKIYIGGITFTISTTEKKASNSITLTYPVIRRITNFSIIQASNQYKKLMADSVANRKQIDTLIQLKTKQFNSAYTEIKVTGITEIEDQRISIYNTEGIKAKVLFGAKLTYTYELAIPIKYLRPVLNGGSKFAYNIKLNGLVGSGDFHRPPARPSQTDNPNNPVYMNILYVENTTDFGGTCQLAKK